MSHSIHENKLGRQKAWFVWYNEKASFISLNKDSYSMFGLGNDDQKDDAANPAPEETTPMAEEAAPSAEAAPAEGGEAEPEAPTEGEAEGDAESAPEADPMA